MKHSTLFECHVDELLFLPGQVGAQAVFHSREARKSHSPVLLPGVSLPLALSAVLLEIVEQMWVNAALFVLFKTPDALHQVRVSLRRLESFLLLTKHLPLSGELLQKISELERLSRRLRSSLTAVREWEIFFQSIVPKLKKRSFPSEDQQKLCLLFRPRQKRSAKKAGKRLDSKPFMEMILETRMLAESFSKLGEGESLESFRSRAILVLGRDVHLRSHVGRSRKGAHRLRIALKSFRYVWEFFPENNWDHPDSPDLEKVREALERLGRLNDFYSLRRRFTKMRKQEGSKKERRIIGRLILWLRRKEKKILDSIGRADPSTISVF
ncbi:MAG: CHAD domain-containing protein [Leptospirillum sp.]|jgi:CHAD domain-containing protein